MILVTNDGTAPTRVKVSIQDWSLTKEGTPVFFKAGGHPYSCAEWIRINPVDFRLGSGQTKEARYTITVPPGVSDGGYRAAVMFEAVPEGAPGEKGRRLQVRGRIVAILYEVVGNPIVKGHVTRLRVEPRKGGLDFFVSVQNVGSVHYRTRGTLTVKDSGGQKLFELEIPDAPVLPSSEREFKISYEKPVPKGKYSVLAILDIGTKELIGTETVFSIE
jgi:P pilus assembly chaperone PapD